MNNEKKQNLWDNPTFIWLLFGVILLAGICARIWQFGQIPADMNQDEAFGGYEAYSLLHYGIDSSGYHFPVYLTTWGSGMNVLNTMLMIPFIALFGLKTWVIRIPQLLVACLSLWVVYLLLRKLTNIRLALLGMFLVAIVPWHIFLSRWGLESNLAPGFLLFGLYFFVKGLDNTKFFLLSALMYGLSLYCYATIWPFVPCILFLQFIYCIYYKKISFNLDLVLSVILLAILALPLILFLLVNMDKIPEIRLPFLSIPKLVYMRDSEISFAHIPENFKNLWNILWTQSDGLPWNSTQRFGLYYFCTIPFFLIGLCTSIYRLIQGFRTKTFSPVAFLLIHFLAGLALGLLISVNVNRVNIIFLPILLLAALGILDTCTWLEQWTSKWIILIPLLFYTIFFFSFEKYYFTEYKTEISGYFSQGLEDATKQAMTHQGTIYVTPGANYARILFYSQEPVTEYRDTVQYTNYPSPFLDVSTFGRFQFDFDSTVPDPSGIYILDSSADTTAYTNTGFTLENYGYYVLAYMP